MIAIFTDGTPAGRYLEEILHHAGLSWRRVAMAELEQGTAPERVLVLAGRSAPSRQARQWMERLVHEGGAVVAVGGAFGIADLLGVQELNDPPLEEGYLALDSGHPLTSELTSSLHIFGATRLRAGAGTGFGCLLDHQRHPTAGDALVVHRAGAGLAVAIAADLPGSVLRIQQGRPIYTDGPPAPDGTAPIDDGILKTDDGVVLSWAFDRERTPLATPEPDCPGKHPDYPAGDTPWFAQPVADELRLLLTRAICWAAAATGQPIPLVWPWPRGLPAVGLISHDSDHNIDASARATLRQLDAAEIRSTWCMQWGPTYPDRYSRETFALVQAAGHETALHYNARPEDGGTWGEEHLRAQLAWLRQETQVEAIVSNKNHYLRWEGEVECFRWLEAAGITSDQSKGPSKKGNVGYPHGSCQPWFPYDAAYGRFIDVLEIPLQTQDLWLTTPYAVAVPILDQAVRHHGVAHFLFHQLHLYRLPEVAAALQRIAAAGRTRGLEWWTGDAITTWERQRRDITVTLNSLGAGRYRLRARTPRAMSGVTLAVILPDGAAAPDADNDAWHGLPALFVTLDLPNGETCVEVVLWRGRSSVVSAMTASGFAEGQRTRSTGGTS